MTIVAMKMEHAIKAPKDGVIKSVLAVAGDVSIFYRIYQLKMSHQRPFSKKSLDCRKKSIACPL